MVYYTAGNGRIGEPADNPVGLVGCVRADDGKEVWTYKLKDSVLGSPTLSSRYVYFGCLDGLVYCLERDTGKLVWSRPVGAETATTPALARCATSGIPVALYVAAGGRVLALSPTTGRVLWQVDLNERAKVPVAVNASPVVEVVRGEDGKERRRIYVAGTLTSTGRVGELYCFEDQLKPVPVE
jgi:outer membrane protein assembly factor BamB